MKPLRVYGEQAEATEFPLPGVSNRSLFGKTSQEGRPNQSLRSITLHHRIRQAPNPYAAEIRKFDAQLREGKIFSKEDLRVYRRVLGKARKHELERHSVILCTCSCAASKSLKILNVRQILIDEAGMATEPETLIPWCASQRRLRRWFCLETTSSFGLWSRVNSCRVWGWIGLSLRGTTGMPSCWTHSTVCIRTSVPSPPWSSMGES